MTIIEWLMVGLVVLVIAWGVVAYTLALAAGRGSRAEERRWRER